MNSCRIFKLAAVGSILAAAVSLHLGCNGAGMERVSILPSNEEWDCNRPFTELPFHEAPGITLPETGVIDNEADWCVLWDGIHASYRPPPPCDTTLADFSREVVLYAALGMKISGGYDVTITCLREDEDVPGLRVRVLETRPGDRCYVAAVLTYPISVVKVDRPVDDAFFETTVTFTDCP